MTEANVKEKEDSKFVVLINHEGRVHVDISGPHINKTTFNRLTLAVKKAYRLHINLYRKQVKRDMNKLELDSLIAEPTTLQVKSNGVVDDPDMIVHDGEKVVKIQTVKVQPVIVEVNANIIKPVVVEPVMTPIKDIPRRASLEEAIQNKRVKALAKKKAEEELVETI